MRRRAAEATPASAVSAAKSGARAVGLIATATRPRRPRSSRSKMSFCGPGAARVDEHRHEVRQPGGVAVRLGMGVGVLAEQVDRRRPTPPPQRLELGSGGGGVARHDELGRHPGDFTPGEARHHRSTARNAPGAVQAPGEDPWQDVTAEVLLDVAVQVGVVFHGRQRVHKTEELGPERRARHGAAHEPLGPERDPEGPRFGTAAPLGDGGHELTDFCLRRGDTRLTACRVTLGHVNRR